MPEQKNTAVYVTPETKRLIEAFMVHQCQTQPSPTQAGFMTWLVTEALRANHLTAERLLAEYARIKGE